jgi:hypothetical protein
MGSGAEQAATMFFRTNADQGTDAAYAMTAPIFRDVTPGTIWSRISSNYSLSRLSDVDWTQHDAEGNVTTVRGTLHREGLSPLPVTVDLRRIDGIWKVATIAFEAPAPADGGATASALAQPATPNTQIAAPVDNSLPPATTDGDAPGPVMSVPRFGPVPGQDRAPTDTVSSSSGGRPGPAGSVVASGQVGPTCMGQLWKQGLRTTGVDCPLYLPTRPGATESCVAHTQTGATTGVAVTYLDYDPATRESTIECRPN